jgi:hypothetical protein
MDSLASLARAFPDLPLSEIVRLNNQATGHSSCNCKKKMTTSGPSRCQALLTFVRILDIPHWYTTGVETTIAQVEAVLRASPMHHLFQLAGPIRPVNNSLSSNTKTIYLEVWDSKAGSAVKELIGRTV